MGQILEVEKYKKIPIELYINLKKSSIKEIYECRENILSKTMIF